SVPSGIGICKFWRTGLCCAPCLSLLNITGALHLSLPHPACISCRPWHRRAYA
ncbi:hypothetical protein HAX54_011756, partial [Datura stramonium]|nr:hypothetical protein [Datura stramonium]